MLIQKFLDAINYRITGGSEFCWSCYGPNAYYIDSDLKEGLSASIIIDTQTHKVYEMEVIDIINGKAFRWVNKEKRENYFKEAFERGVNGRIAFDKVEFEDVMHEEVLEKIKEYTTKKVFEVDDFSGYNLITEKGV